MWLMRTFFALWLRYKDVALLLDEGLRNWLQGRIQLDPAPAREGIKIL